MTNDTFTEILRHVKLPAGTLLSDGTTYRLEKDDFPAGYEKELKSFEKILVLSDGQMKAVGGVLFYDSYDIQVTTLVEYRDKGYMSSIHRNGVLASECYPKQRVTLATEELESMDDFLLRYHMLSLAGLKVANLSDVYNTLKMFRKVFGSSSRLLVEGEDFKKLKNTALLVRKALLSVTAPLNAKIKELTDRVRILTGKVEKQDESLKAKDKEIATLNQRISVIDGHSKEDSQRAANYQAYTDYCKTVCRQHGIFVPSMNDFMRGTRSSKDIDIS